MWESGAEIWRRGVSKVPGSPHPTSAWSPGEVTVGAPRPPRPKTPCTKGSPHPGRAGSGGGGWGGAKRGREVLGALNWEKTSQAGELQDLGLEREEPELKPQRRPRPLPPRAARSLFWLLGSHSLGTPPLRREEKGRGPRAPLRLLGPLPVAGAPPQPAQGPPPLLLQSLLPSPARDNGCAV